MYSLKLGRTELRLSQDDAAWRASPDRTLSIPHMIMHHISVYTEHREPLLQPL